MKTNYNIAHANALWKKSFYTLLFSIFCLQFAMAQNTCGINFSTTENEITVTDLDAPHYILKVYNPNWSINFQCTDDCADPLTVANLSIGTYHLRVNNYDANWNHTCDFLVDIEVTGETSGGTLSITCPEDMITTGTLEEVLENIETLLLDVVVTDNTSCPSDGFTITSDNDINAASGSNFTVETTVTVVNGCGDEAVCSFFTTVISDPCSGIGDADGDDICDNVDNCPNTYNPDQSDSNSNGIGDACENIGNGDCSDIILSTNANNGSITISGLTAPIEIAKIFNANWQIVASCSNNCGNTLTETNLPEGLYHIRVNMYSESWAPICQLDEDVILTTAMNTNISVDFCPADISLDGLPGNPLQEVSWDEPEASTSCPDGGLTYTLDNFSPPSGTPLNNGNYTINYTINDACGNTATCSFEINISFWTAMIEITCPANITVDATAENGAIVSWDEPTVITDCPSGFTLSQANGPDNGSLFPIGVTTIQYNAYGVGVGNGCGQQDQCFFDITVFDPNPANACGFLKNYGQPFPEFLGFGRGSVSASETSNGFYLSTTGQLNIQFNKTLALNIDQDGNFVSKNDFNTPIDPIQITASTTDDNKIVVERTVGLNWETTIDFSDLLNDIIAIPSASVQAVSDGYMVIGSIIYNNGTFILYAAKLDPNGNLINRDVFSDSSGDITYLVALLESPDDGYFARIFRTNQERMAKLDADGNWVWVANLATDLPSTDVFQSIVSPDGSFVASAVYDNQRGRITIFDAATGDRTDIRPSEILSPNNSISIQEFFRTFFITQDNGIVVAYPYQNTDPFEPGFEYGKFYKDGTLAWWNSLPTTYNNLSPVLEASDGGILFVGTFNEGTSPNDEEVVAMKVTADGQLNPTCGGNTGTGTELDCAIFYTLENEILTLNGSGLDAPHAIIKLFSPTWSTVFSCNDNCNNPISIPNIADGTYHLSVNLYDADWSPICNFLEDLPTDGITPRLSNEIMIDQFRNILLENIYPIPADNRITVEIASLETTEIVAALYDARGVIIDKKMLPLQAGSNVIDWDINRLPSGFYQILFETGSSHAPVRFLKQGM